MAILTRVPFGDIELLSVNAAPYGISALTGSLAVLNSNGTVYRNNGTSWTTVNKESKIIQSTYNQNTTLGGEFGAPGFTSVTCPFDDTIPQHSEGSVCLTSTPITTKSSTSTIRITFNGVFAVNIVGRGITSLLGPAGCQDSSFRVHELVVITPQRNSNGEEL